MVYNSIPHWSLRTASTFSWVAILPGNPPDNGPDGLLRASCGQPSTFFWLGLRAEGHGQPRRLPLGGAWVFFSRVRWRVVEGRRKRRCPQQYLGLPRDSGRGVTRKYEKQKKIVTCTTFAIRPVLGADCGLFFTLSLLGTGAIKHFILLFAFSCVRVNIVLRSSHSLVFNTGLF